MEWWERLAGVGRVLYLLNKFGPLAAVRAVQAGLMHGLVCSVKGAGGVPWMQLVGLMLASWNGTALGLAVSATARNADRATAVVPDAMLPQIVLARVLIALPDMNGPTRVAAGLSAARWANQAMEVAAFEGRAIDAGLFRRPADVWPLWNLYPDYDLREDGERVRFLRDHAGGRVQQAGRLAVDGAALAGLLVIQLVAAGAILRRQDAL